MKKRISKTIVAIAIVTAFLMPLMGNTALADPMTEKYHFNSYNVGEAWTTSPGNMVDGSTSTFASTNSDGDVQLLNDNTCDDTSGTITSVKIRAYGYYDRFGNSADIILQPVFSAGDGDRHTFNALDREDWSELFDITTDTNAPSPWTWDDVAGLDCDVEADGSGLFTLKCAKVQIQVTYTTE